MLDSCQQGWIKVGANTDLSVLQRTHQVRCYQFAHCLIFFPFFDGFTELERLHTYPGISAPLEMAVRTQPGSGL